MGSFVQEIVQGRKTFFLAPDKTMIPESFLEDYLAIGYECYIIDTDLVLPMSQKADIILSVFKDSILFFNVDAALINESWPEIIKNLLVKYPDSKLGVTYTKRQTASEKLDIERLYLMDIGIQCGCIQLEYQKKNNFAPIQHVLYANQAQGRRKNVRAVCTGSCSVKFTQKNGRQVSARLNDVSISHFSFTIENEDELQVGEFERISDAQFMIKGLHFESDAVLFASRPTERGKMYIFAFCTKGGQQGLEPLVKQLIIPKMYSIMVDNTQALLNKLFHTAMERNGGRNHLSELPAE